MSVCEKHRGEVNMTLVEFPKESCPHCKVEELTEKLENEKKFSADILHLLDNSIVVMQCACIEWKKQDAETAMEWIQNTLAGPGLLPTNGDMEASAQDYYDKHYKPLMGGQDG